jgi:predicted RNA binding protein YcfA (HicA-like mRNA interferase family)
MLLYRVLLVKYGIIEMKGCRDETVPVKIRKLKAELRRAGFVYEPGKGSHTRWYYPHDRTIKVILSGNDGDDADKYQIKQVYNALKRVKEL